MHPSPSWSTVYGRSDKRRGMIAAEKFVFRLHVTVGSSSTNAADDRFDEGAAQRKRRLSIMLSISAVFAVSKYSAASEKVRATGTAAA